MTTSQTFKKNERLTSKTAIEALFAKGKSVSALGFKLIWVPHSTSLKISAQIVFVVPKRSFKNATDRNKIKRRMREVWRKNKQQVYDHLKANELKLALGWLYVGKKIPEYNEVQNAFEQLIKKLKSTL